jgi:hypothetical protein
VTIALNVVQANDVGVAWAKAMVRVAAAPGREIHPFLVTIATNGNATDDPRIRGIADQAISTASTTPIATVSSTIFPSSLWNPNLPPSALFCRYERIWPNVRRNRANAHGTYFRRFTAFGATGVNQVAHVLATWRQGNHRRSALQLAVLDPAQDHTHQRQRGFPCLHQVALVPDNGGLRITGFYGMQLVFEKAYGNYMGLARLGEFFAAEMGLSLASVTCVASVAKLSQSSALTPILRKRLCAALSAEIHKHP